MRISNPPTGWLQLPRRTVRLKLTALYGGLFLISGTALLALNYALVSNATQGALSYRGDDGLAGSIDELPEGSQPAQTDEGLQLTPLPGNAQAEMLRDQATQQRADNMRELLVQSGIALAVMAVVSVLLGWVVAGRILRRLRTITQEARDISAADLHKRLDLPGPEDELKELGDTFDDLLCRLESSFQAHQLFVANASHELLTPLARQRVISQVALADNDATTKSLRAAHERVLVAGSEQQKLVEALLTLARGQAGLASRAPFDLAVLAEQTLTTRRPEAQNRGLTVRTQLRAAPSAGDPQLAERLVTNLVDNALRHNTDCGWLEVITDIEEDRPVLRVTNTGPELQDTALDRLFQPFQRLQAHRTSGAGGHGLGLSIVRAIADAHDATIQALPRSDGGLSISVTFPPHSINHATSDIFPEHDTTDEPVKQT